MIKVTKLNGEEFYVNHFLIEKVDVLPNCVITMNSQIQYVVRENIDQINELIMQFHRKLGKAAQENMEEH